MGGNGLSGLSFMREYIQLPNEDSQRISPSPAHQQQQVNHQHHSTTPQFSPNHLFDPSGFLGHSSSSNDNYIPTPSIDNSAPTIPPFRPTSAASHHSYSNSAASSIVDPSEYYSTTDMDTDDDDLSSINDIPGLAVNSNIGDLGMGNIDLSGPPAIMTWTPYRPTELQATQKDENGVSPFSNDSNHNHSVSPSELVSAGVSPSAVSTSSRRSGAARPRKGSVRGVGGDVPEEQKKLDKLEHRRDINRRSAQKHRARRKEEVDIMTRTIAEKDARIAQLERDLEVEKARNDQLRNLMNARLAGGPGTATAISQAQGQSYGSAHGFL
ncbi:hypothetical protein I317_05447 [Kwoniella heveanensis CBS 569]|nr:hypothetical protein I317_05447 [Kwoniella heveanensis CBS 569]